MVTGIESLRVDSCVIESLGEFVHNPGFFIGIAQLELFFGEFAIDIQNRIGCGDLVGYLYGEDGLPDVGIREEASNLPLEPEGHIQIPGSGA